MPSDRSRLKEVRTRVGRRKQDLRALKPSDEQRITVNNVPPTTRAAGRSKTADAFDLIPPIDPRPAEAYCLAGERGDKAKRMTCSTRQ